MFHHVTHLCAPTSPYCVAPLFSTTTPVFSDISNATDTFRRFKPWEPFPLTDTRKSVTSRKKYTLLDSQTCIRGSTPFFFSNPPIYWNTLWGTFIKVGRACKGSGNGIANVRYQMIFIASSPRAISTLCQHRRFILEAICTWLNCSAQSSIVTAFNAK